jgi:hypothetical protein
MYPTLSIPLHYLIVLKNDQCYKWIQIKCIYFLAFAKQNNIVNIIPLTWAQAKNIAEYGLTTTILSFQA